MRNKKIQLVDVLIPTAFLLIGVFGAILPHMEALTHFQQVMFFIVKVIALAGFGGSCFALLRP
jgi:hypothetical protein